MFVNQYFPGTASLIGGLTLKQIQEETISRYSKCFISKDNNQSLDEGGEFAFRIKGEKHSWSPSSITNLQKAVRINSKNTLKIFQKKSIIIIGLCTLLEVFLTLMKQKKIPLEKVEPASEIVKRFSTGAMSTVQYLEKHIQLLLLQ